MQPDISARLKERKLNNMKATAPEVIATGNIGCIMQLADGAAVPVLHTVKLLDWAYGGPKPTGVPEGRRPAPAGKTKALLSALS